MFVAWVCFVLTRGVDFLLAHCSFDRIVKVVAVGVVCLGVLCRNCWSSDAPYRLTRFIINGRDSSNFSQLGVCFVEEMYKLGLFEA